MKNTKFFSCLVGYFYASGFFKIYKELEDVEKIRVLVGININQQTFDMLSASRSNQLTLKDSTSEIKKELENKIINEYETSKDTEKYKLLEIKNPELEVKKLRLLKSNEK